MNLFFKHFREAMQSANVSLAELHVLFEETYEFESNSNDDSRFRRDITSSSSTRWSLPITYRVDSDGKTFHHDKIFLSRSEQMRDLT